MKTDIPGNDNIYQVVKMDDEGFRPIYNAFAAATTNLKVVKRPTEESPFDNYTVRGSSKTTDSIELELTVKFERPYGLKYIIDVTGDAESVVNNEGETREFGSISIEYDPKGILGRFDETNIRKSSPYGVSEGVIEISDKVEELIQNNEETVKPGTFYGSAKSNSPYMVNARNGLKYSNDFKN